MLDHSADGACGAQDCHPATTEAAFDHGQYRKKYEMSDAGKVPNTNRVTMPKLPPSVSPAMPTVGHDPPGITRPWANMPLYTSIRRAPAPMAAVVPDTTTSSNGVSATISPALDDHPA